MKSKKNNIRKQISDIKKKYKQEDLIILSEEIISVLEATDTFCKAKHILIYKSLKDEVQTDSLIDKYHKEKTFYLPVVKDYNKLVIKEYNLNTKFEKSNLGILEPIGSDLSDLKKIDLIIVPGIAFDKNLNRLGRGKGYYDKFLKQMRSSKIGLAFDFQLLDEVPTENHDIPMDMIVLENEIICNSIY